jgi:GNAT superfamily N-acetyltransferase
LVFLRPVIGIGTHGSIAYGAPMFAGRTDRGDNAVGDENLLLASMGIAIRFATEGDAAVIAGHRVGMFRDMGQVPSEELSAWLLKESTSVLGVALRDGSYIGWLAHHGDKQVIAGAGVHIKPHLPRITNDGVRVTASPVPLAVNVYTEPEWRQRGIARALMQAIMRWATEQGFDRVVLHASDAGRPLYRSLGFAATNEMRWWPPESRRTRRNDAETECP